MCNGVTYCGVARIRGSSHAFCAGSPPEAQATYVSSGDTSLAQPRSSLDTSFASAPAKLMLYNVGVQRKRDDHTFLSRALDADSISPHLMRPASYSAGQRGRDLRCRGRDTVLSLPANRKGEALEKSRRRKAQLGKGGASRSPLRGENSVLHRASRDPIAGGQVRTYTPLHPPWSSVSDGHKPRLLDSGLPLYPFPVGASKEPHHEISLHDVMWHSTDTSTAPATDSPVHRKPRRRYKHDPGPSTYPRSQYEHPHSLSYPDSEVLPGGIGSSSAETTTGLGPGGSSQEPRTYGSIHTSSGTSSTPRLSQPLGHSGSMQAPGSMEDTDLTARGLKLDAGASGNAAETGRRASSQPATSMDAADNMDANCCVHVVSSGAPLLRVARRCMLAPDPPATVANEEQILQMQPARVVVAQVLLNSYITIVVKET
jgi:hypothetical protein